MNHRIARFASAAVIGAALVLPGAAFAADPEPVAHPAAVADWQAHLDHMRSMDGTMGSHVRGCIEMHGSMAGLFGPNGSMVEMMGEGMMR
jgi:hypothetical protein